MAFSTILFGVLGAYGIYYAVNIAYDLFKAGSSPRQSYEEEIDIEEAENTLPLSTFDTFIPSEDTSSEEIPVLIAEETPTAEETLSDEEEVQTVEDYSEPSMNGGIAIDDLCAMIQQAPRPSDLEIVATSWNNSTV